MNVTAQIRRHAVSIGRFMAADKRPDQQANLDVLRSIAVLAVLVFHLSQLYLRPMAWLKWGHFGVLVFFVHTSFVLMMSLERLAARSRKILAPFYIQRAFRIYPLSVLCVLSVVICRVPDTILFVHYTGTTPLKLISNLLLIQNITGVPSVSAPLWSLPYEVQMYVVLPLIYVLVTRWPKWWMPTALIALSLGLANFHYFPPLSNLATYYPCFMGGILAFVLRRRRKAFLPAWVWPLWIMALGWFFQSVSFSRESLVCLALGLSIGFFQELKSGFMANAAHQIAKYSYGIYLVHVPLMVVCFDCVPVNSMTTKWILFVLLLPLFVGVLYHRVEEPFIRLGKRLTKASDEIPPCKETGSVLRSAERSAAAP